MSRSAVGFTDRASSLTALNGYWILQRRQFREGDCRTFGPGDYPNLSSDLDPRFLSGRRIADGIRTKDGELAALSK